MNHFQLGIPHWIIISGHKFLCEEIKCCRFSFPFSYWWGFQKPVHVPRQQISPWSRCSHAQRNPAWKSCGAWKQSSVGCISSVLLVWLMLICKYNQRCWYRCIIQSQKEQYLVPKPAFNCVSEICTLQITIVKCNKQCSSPCRPNMMGGRIIWSGEGFPDWAHPKTPLRGTKQK